MTARRLPVIVAGALLVVGGCGADKGAADVAEPVFALDRDIASQIVDVSADRGVVMPAFDLRLLLQALLSDHATLSNEAMRRAIDGDRGVDSTLIALTDNTDQITLAIGVVYGPDGANAFDQLWTNHIEFFNSYARAIEAEDSAAAQDAIDALGHYEHDFSDFVDVASGGEAGLESVLRELHSHVTQLLSQADLWQRGDYEAAIAVADDAFRHMDAIAVMLSGAIAAQQAEAFPGDVDDPDRSSCVSARLDVASWIVASADVSTAERLGRDDYLAAAIAALEDAETKAVDRIEPAESQELRSALPAFDAAPDPTSVRAQLIADVLPIVTASACVPQS